MSALCPLLSFGPRQRVTAEDWNLSFVTVV
jgi:hypothetical protein